MEEEAAIEETQERTNMVAVPKEKKRLCQFHQDGKSRTSNRSSPSSFLVVANWRQLWAGGWRLEAGWRTENSEEKMKKVFRIVGAERNLVGYWTLKPRKTNWKTIAAMAPGIVDKDSVPPRFHNEQYGQTSQLDVQHCTPVPARGEDACRVCPEREHQCCTPNR